MTSNIFNTQDRELATQWLQHPKYSKYKNTQKLFVVEMLSQGIRVQNPEEYDEPRFEFITPEFIRGMVERYNA
jgi:hypothetical protein